MSSISQEQIGLQVAATLAPRIVVARVREIAELRYPGSAEHAPQKEGESLPYYHVEVLRTLKGPPVAAGEELRIFNGQHWYYHVHAALIRDNVLSFSETHYRSELPAHEIGKGSEIVFFISQEPMPAGFPPGSAFMSFGSGFERLDREAAVLAAVQSGPYTDFNLYVQLQRDGRVRFPDGLEIRLLGNGHKRPMTDGPRCEFTELGLTRGEASGSIQLNHVIEPDGAESWDSRGWDRYQIQLRGIGQDGSSTFIVVAGPLGSP